MIEAAPVVLSAALALVFVVAAGAKALDLAGTEDEFASLGLIRPGLLARLMPVVEVGVAGLLLVVPPIGGALAVALLAAFTTVLVGVLRSGRTVTCRCFGSISNRPISRWTLARNGLLLIVASVVALS